jgi:hypothetical protein
MSRGHHGEGVRTISFPRTRYRETRACMELTWILVLESFLRRDVEMAGVICGAP